MTACVETQKKNLEGGALSNKIIRAILAVVLVIGLAPTLNVGTAYAATDQDLWDQATFTYNVAPDANGNYSFQATGAPVEFSVSSVVMADGTAVAAKGYTVKYYDSGKTEIKGKAPQDVGIYYIGTAKNVLNKQGELEASTIIHYQKFTITVKSLDAAVPYLVVADKTDVSNVPVYNGTAFTIGQAEGNINFAIDGKPLISGTDYANISTSVAAAAGDTTVALKGAGAYAGYTKNVKVTVAPLDLSKALVSFDDRVKPSQAMDMTALAKACKINGNNTDEGNLLASIVAFKGVNASGAPATVEELGHYTIAVTPNNKNIIGNASAEFNVVTKLNSGFKYSDKEFTSTPLTFDASLGEAFDLAKITVTDLTDQTTKGFTTVVTDKDGNVVTDYSKPGTYTATTQVTIDPSTYAEGGKASQPFTVVKGKIEDATVYVSLDGKNIDPSVTDKTPLEVTYTGKAFVPTVVIKDAAGKALVAGTDYTVAYKDDKSAVVPEIVAPGTYSIVITSDTYILPSTAISGACKVKVNQSSITGYQIAQTTFDKSTTGIPATGEAIVPVVQYKTGATDPVTKKPIWTTLDASLYTITYAVNATKAPVAAADLKAAGAYTATITLTTDAQKIYDAKGPSTAEFNIIDKTGFVDVAPSIWYAASVSKAAELGYMTGLSGTKLFAPEASITRADVACVIGNMAGYKKADNLDDELLNYFSDVYVASGARAPYYAANVNWAKKAGIMNGYVGTTLFGPNDQITREQFACTLYNYAKAYNKDITVDTKAELAKFPDSAQVSDFAQTAVAWAAKNKIMGNAGVLNPAAQVTRAEVAAMTVNFQPEKM
ncbi:MAG: S-layer homology domain-containing protein [Raoultibacter sp.]